MHRLAALLFAVALAAPVHAQSHPNFSGKWVLDPKTAEGDMAPAAESVTLVQDDKTLKVDQFLTTPMGGQHNLLTFNIDGTPSKNRVGFADVMIDLNSIASWDGPTLVIKTTTSIQGQSMQQNDRWTLAADGKSLTMQRDGTMGDQAGSAKLTFNKQ